MKFQAPERGIYALALMLIASFSSRFINLDFRACLGLFVLSGILAFSSLAGCFQNIWSGPDDRPRANRIGFLVGTIGTFLFGGWLIAGVSTPVIADISTDTENPPKFEKILPLRKGSEVPSEHQGKKIFELQRKGYPDIQPLLFEAKPDAIYPKVLKTAKELEFEIVSTEKERFRIEAFEKTRWFGFTDDVIIQLKEIEPGLTRLDMRSVSRVGKSDLGTNARRIRRFFSQLSKEISPAGQK